MDTFKKTMELNISFFLLQLKNKKALKNYKRLSKETKNQIEAIMTAMMMMMMMMMMMK